MFKTRLRTLLIALLGLFIVAAAALVMRPAPELSDSDPVGLVERSFSDDSRDRMLDAYVWYPTDQAEPVEMVNANIVFNGFTAVLTASVDIGSDTAPLVVFSHGSGGNRGNQGWLALELARQGAIVVAASHPGSMSLDSAPETNIQTWNRPADISFVIDAMLADAQFGPLIDADRIAVVGHSLGGYTALAIGGGELSLDQYIAFCNDFPSAPDCAFYREGGVDLTQVDRERFEQVNRDARVKAVVAIDPAFAWSFTDATVADMQAMLITAPESGGFDAPLDGSHLQTQMSLGDNFIELEGAHHFSFLPSCKSIGYYLLMVMEEDGEFLCWSEAGRERAEIQAETSNRIAQFLTDQSILR